MSSGTPKEVFEIIRDAWKAGRPIVPLLGAGVSVAAGIPVVRDIEEYFVKLVFEYAERDDKGGLSLTPLQERIRTVGWPSRHQLNADVMLKLDAHGMNPHDALSRMRRRIYIEAVKRELGHVHPTTAATFQRLSSDRGSGLDAGLDQHSDWRALLDLITHGDRRLKDAYFDRLVRGRRPSATHQFIAFLTKLLNSNLVFTTNFDDLIEEALRDEALVPVVYEITLDAQAPASQLVVSHLAIVKLHGGAFGLRAGMDLDEPLDDGTLSTFMKYMSENALLLVVGYGGGDRRVMSLIEAMAKPRRGTAEMPRVVWLHRGSVPAPAMQVASGAVDGARSIEFRPFRDARLFFQELYQRLTVSHAVARTPYSVLHHLPTPLAKAQVPALPDSTRRSSRPRHEGTTYRVHLFRTRGASVHASRRLAEFVAHEEVDGRYQVIWVDLHVVSTAATLAAILVEQMCRHDRWLIPLVNPLHEPVDFASGSRRPLKERDPEAWNATISWFVDAMQRGRYLIAIDNVADFGLFHPSDPLFDLNINKQNRVLQRRSSLRLCDMLDFLYEMVSNAEAFGESKLCLALAPPEWEEKPGQGRWWRQLRNHRIFLQRQTRVIADPHERGPDAGPPESSFDVAHVADWLAADVRSVGSRELAVRFTILVCSAFRRPRTIVGLFDALHDLRAAYPALGPYGKLSPLVRNLFDAFVAETAPSAQHKLRDRIVALIKDACGGGVPLRDPPLLARQDGGLYTMDRGLRDAVYTVVAQAEREHGDSSFLLRLHDILASYYHDQLYQQSRDMNAYAEYLFHRLVSAELARDRPRERSDLLQWLTSSLVRERQLLMARTRLSTLRVALGRIQDALAPPMPPPTPPNSAGPDARSAIPERDRAALRGEHEVELLQLTDDILGECLRDVGDFAGALHHAGERAKTLALPRVRSGDRRLSDERELGIDLAVVRRLVADDGQRYDPDDPRLHTERCADVEYRIQRFVEECGLSSADGEWGPRLEIKFYLAQMGFVLRLVERNRVPAMLLETLQRLFVEWRDRAEERVRPYFGAARAPRYKCYLRCHSARFHYLLHPHNPDFSLAYKLLNEAQATVFQPANPSERTALAVSHLYLAELNIVDAVYRLRSELRFANREMFDDLQILRREDRLTPKLEDNLPMLHPTEIGDLLELCGELDAVSGRIGLSWDVPLGLKNPGDCRERAERVRTLACTLRDRWEALCEAGRDWSCREGFEEAARLLASSPFREILACGELATWVAVQSREDAESQIRRLRRMTERDARILERVAHQLTRRVTLKTARRASELLGRARVAIGQAASLLSAGIRNAEWWTFLSTLRARLAFEILELEQHARDLEGWQSGIDPTEILLEALGAIRAGLENSPRDVIRRRELARIWQQLRQCYHSHVIGDAQRSWDGQNTRAGLRKYLDFLARPLPVVGNVAAAGVLAAMRGGDA